MIPQLELFPFVSPATVVSYLQRLEILTLKYAPELTATECSHLLGELSILTLIIERPHAHSLDNTTPALVPVPRLKSFTMAPETILAALRQLVPIIEQNTAKLDVPRLIHELRETHALMVTIGRAIEQRPAWQHRQTLPEPNPAETLRASERIAFSQIVIPHRRRGRGARSTHQRER